MWRARAFTETMCAPRTWFLTLTLSPSWRMRVLALARQRARQRHGEDFDALSEARRFQMITDAAGPLVTKYWKRVRKERAVPLRYLLIVEQHQDGWPHFHALVHEVVPGLTLTERVLRSQWRDRHGYAEAKLVDDTNKAVRYVTKYIVKASLARVRASVDYGNPRANPLAKA